jgi:hypothetical protein
MNQSGISPVALRLLQLGIPVTVENYLDYAYTDPVPNPVPAEMLAEAEEAVRSIQQLH